MLGGTFLKCFGVSPTQTNTTLEKPCDSFLQLSAWARARAWFWGTAFSTCFVVGPHVLTCGRAQIVHTTLRAFIFMHTRCHFGSQAQGSALWAFALSPPSHPTVSCCCMLCAGVLVELIPPTYPLNPPGQSPVLVHIGLAPTHRRRLRWWCEQFVAGGSVASVWDSVRSAL